ncbi:family 43 glycosylhydrolase [Mucilaginibacter daejeonensis]|uniref:family 43 glycosylhydrolase n=1 Tax=Mucilaginibacter daejeonensis TaxID=398049 RepID=UPI001D1727E0|nr:family 43 glycosylhydrolase [Mucilaginibacter daejeonensis]UEG52254.1 family 43 glycosylhydrolase [Mucilaginibacter daejeonensis]
MNKHLRSAALLILSAINAGQVNAQDQPKPDASFYRTVKTYVNPVLPGDHPDPTLLKVGDDFYHCGSTFHFNPYLPIYHSKDLVHWKVISRVLTAADAKWVNDRPSTGIWQGAITYFYGSYWIYFSAGGQWFCKASSPKGPWSKPVEVKTNRETGPLGYDNSIFVDDDGKPYMVIKNGQKVNRLQALGRDGQLTDKVINLDWINAKLQYSWAEGPVMCKRNGYYYYFPAGDVSGGQYVLRASALTSDSTKWERLGNFFKPISDAKVGFRRPNHIAAPIQLKDGTWWTIGQSYERYDGDDWSGTGRQTGLYPVMWEDDRPWGMAPTTQPIVKPQLPQGGISWRSVTSDRFDNEVLGLDWHFLTKRASGNYSLTARKGWVRLTPDSGSTHLMQKETDHWYTAVTKVDLDASAPDQQAGIYLTNGDQKVNVKLFTGFDNGKKIIFKMDTAVRTTNAPAGSTVWLKVERNLHMLTGYFSINGQNWTSLGAPIDARPLDKVQPNYNSWVGTSLGLFAQGKPADFDLFICKDGYSPINAAGYSNYFGVDRDAAGVTTTTDNGGWFMISGVDLGTTSPSAISLTAAGKGKLEVWVDDLQTGKLIAQASINGSSGGNKKVISKLLKKVTGQHDVFVRFLPETAKSLMAKEFSFTR